MDFIPALILVTGFGRTALAFLVRNTYSTPVDLG